MGAYLIVAITVAVVALLVIVVWVAYAVSAAYQQTLQVSLSFSDSYRYWREARYSIDKIDVTVTGTRRNDILVDVDSLREVVTRDIVEPYRRCLLIHEPLTFTIDSDTVTVDDIKLKRCPIANAPSLENLSVLFFNRLAPSLLGIGAQLASVTLYSDGLVVTQARYKISTYRV